MLTHAQLLQVQAAAYDSKDERAIEDAWLALGYHRHPAFLPANDDDQRAGAERCESLASKYGIGAPRSAPPIPAGTRCHFGSGEVRAYLDTDQLTVERYTVIAPDGSRRLGVLREQLEVIGGGL